MASIPNSPSVGIDALTGGTVSGWAHVEQSLRDIFFTRFGERVMREWYGSFVPDLLGRNITPEEVVPFFAAMASAIEQFEPRFRVTAITPVKVTRAGEIEIFLSGEYRPRAVFGDLSVEGSRRVELYANADGLRIADREAGA